MRAEDVAGLYLDTDLVCSDGVISYPKLVAGLVFPCLASCEVLEFPSRHTLLLPDYTSADLINTVQSLLGKNLLSPPSPPSDLKVKFCYLQD